MFSDMMPMWSREELQSIAPAGCTWVYDWDNNCHTLVFQYFEYAPYEAFNPALHVWDDGRVAVFFEALPPFSFEMRPEHIEHFQEMMQKHIDRRVTRQFDSFVLPYARLATLVKIIDFVEGFRRREGY